MTTQKLEIKVPLFGKDDYNNWKNKMLLYNICKLHVHLENGLHIPMKIISESVENWVWVPQKSTSKEPSKFIDTENEYVALDHNLQLIIM